MISWQRLTNEDAYLEQYLHPSVQTGDQKTPTLRADIEKTLRDLIEDPFLPHLGTHKLKGKLSGSWACSVGYNLRIVFDFVEDEKREKDDILLIDVGTHEEVY